MFALLVISDSSGWDNGYIQVFLAGGGMLNEALSFSMHTETCLGTHLGNYFETLSKLTFISVGHKNCMYRISSEIC